MQIKTIDKRNSHQLVALFCELEQYYFAAQAANADEIRAYFERGLFSADSGVKVVGAQVAGEILAFASYSLLYPAPRLSGQLYMKDLFVSQRARGQGLGKALMVHLANYALEKGCQRMDWTAESTNPKAGQFYQALGAQWVAEKQYFRFESDSLKQFAGQ